MVNYGMPVLWITLNPSDLRSFLVLVLAGMRFVDNDQNISADLFAQTTATMNLVAVAKFFEATCTGIFEHLLAAGSQEGGLLGPVSTYFGTVETNGCGMLHLHCLVWLSGAFHLSKIREQLQTDDKYAADMVQFVDRIIWCSISEGNPDDINNEPPSALLPETDREFMAKLEQDSNNIAAKTQLHSSFHNATCYKYGAAASKQCRFDFPRPRINETTITKQGTIDIYRNNVWINPWCPSFASLTRSNHDINFIPSSIKALALVRYITNYTTKGDCSQYQRMMGAAFVRRAYEEGADQRMANTGVGAVRVLDIDKFALRAFNRLAYDHEISGPLVKNTLLELPEYYTPDRIIRRVNLRALRCRFKKIIFDVTDEENIVNDFVRFRRSRDVPSSSFEDSYFRGPELAHYSFFDYQKTISVVKYISSATIEGDIHFAKDHPNRKSKIQRPLTSGSYTPLIALMGPLSTNKTVEDAVQGGHPETDARQNNLGMVLLALFIPWD